MQDMQPPSSLTKLGTLPLQIVVAYLTKDDKRSLAVTCRGLASAVSASCPNTGLTVTAQTGWKGIYKILTTSTVNCKTLKIEGNVALQRDNTSADKALDVLLGSLPAMACSFPGIQRVIIKARPLPCLLPTNIASILPDLETLSVSCCRQQYADDPDLQPIPYCSSLQELSYVVGFGCQLALPNKHHTAEDLRTQLPSIKSLKFKSPLCYISASSSCINTMLHAWGHQLTILYLTMPVTPLQLHRCTCLQSLTWEEVKDDSEQPLVFLPSTVLPTSLTALNILSIITETVLQTILQLPLLETLSFHGFQNHLQHDWHKHSCAWRQLSIGTLPFGELAKLPLQSMRGKGCLNISVLELPNPLLPDSLDRVMHTAQFLKDANIIIEQLKHWDCKVWEYRQLQLVSEVDQPSAELLLAASKVVKPCELYWISHSNMPHFPQTTTATLKWLSPKLRELRLSIGNHLIQPWLWQALQCCSNLVEARFHFPPDMPIGKFVDKVTTLAVQASIHLVAAISRPILLVVTHLINEKTASMQDTLLELKLRLQEESPPMVTVRLCTCTWDTPFKLRISPKADRSTHMHSQDKGSQEMH